VIRNTDQYTRLSSAVEQLNRAAATDLIIFAGRYEDGRKDNFYAKRNQFSWLKSREKDLNALHLRSSWERKRFSLG
jgi:hypothetical protein